MSEKKTALCVCMAGRNRSRALALELRRHGWRASWCGRNHGRVLRVANDIADAVLVVDFRGEAEEKVRRLVNDEKVFVAHTGKDVWGRHDHPALVAVAERCVLRFLSEYREREEEEAKKSSP